MHERLFVDRNNRPHLLTSSRSMRVAGFLFFRAEEDEQRLRTRSREARAGQYGWRSLVVGRLPTVKSARRRVSNFPGFDEDKHTTAADIFHRWGCGCCRISFRSRTMFQDSADADYALRGLTFDDSAGRPQAGCCMAGVVRPANVRPCRELQESRTPGRSGLENNTACEAENLATDLKSSQWSKGDSWATGANRKATFGDTRRQLFRFQVGSCGSVRPDRRWSALASHPPESKQTERFMTIGTRAVASECRAPCKVLSRFCDLGGLENPARRRQKTTT